jgi:hypothetical protein
MGPRPDLDGCGGEKIWIEVRIKFLGVRIFVNLFLKLHSTLLWSVDWLGTTNVWIRRCLSVTDRS